MLNVQKTANMDELYLNRDIILSGPRFTKRTNRWETNIHFYRKE